MARQVTRKSRLPRLDVARYYPTPICITDLGWTQIEAALNEPLSPCRRNAITKLVDQYLLHEGAERAAPFDKDEDRWLKQAAQAAAEFERLFLIEPMTDRAARSGLAEVQVLFSRTAQNSWGVDVPLDNFSAFLKRAFDDLLNGEKHPGMEEGTCWSRLIKELQQLLKKWGISTSIRKDSDKRKDDVPPVFVAFFSELQSCFPEDARRHTQSLASLAKAMNLARRDQKASLTLS